MDEIRPHDGPQEEFLSTPADIAIYGGQAGGGKTFALLIEPMRHIQTVQDFGAVIFRRTSPQITREGGLWDESVKLYLAQQATPRAGYHDWTFPPFGNKVTFSAMEHEADRYDWDGAQIPLIGFDQLEHFTEMQFFYMLSRNRSTCGVRPYIRATANPNPDSWLKNFILWWLDERGEYPDESKSGVLRYFIRVGEEIHWSDDPSQLINEFAEVFGGRQFVPEPMSVTFIPASLADNPTLVELDPGYINKLRSLPRVERERLEKGNWLVKPAAGYYFQRDYFNPTHSSPSIIKTRVRWWDLAGTAEQHTTRKRHRTPDYTAGVLMSITHTNRVTIENVKRLRRSPAEVRQAVRACAEYDPPGTVIGLHQDPGQAGKDQVESYIRMLVGHTVKTIRETGDLETRCQPFSSYAENGQCDLIVGKWNEAFYTELENYPDVPNDDQVASSSSAFNFLTGAKRAGTWGR
jgi:predicted phage terminase large subunit-like protein